VNDFQGRSGWACPVGSTQPCAITGADILQQLGFEGDSVGRAFLGLLLLLVSDGWKVGAVRVDRRPAVAGGWLSLSRQSQDSRG